MGAGGPLQQPLLDSGVPSAPPLHVGGTAYAPASAPPGPVGYPPYDQLQQQPQPGPAGAEGSLPANACMLPCHMPCACQTVTAHLPMQQPASLQPLSPLPNPPPPPLALPAASYPPVMGTPSFPPQPPAASPPPMQPPMQQQQQTSAPYAPPVVQHHTHVYEGPLIQRVTLTPVLQICPSCGHTGATRVRRERGCCTWLQCFTMCWLFCPLFWLPCCLNCR